MASSGTSIPAGKRRRTAGFPPAAAGEERPSDTGAAESAANASILKSARLWTGAAPTAAADSAIAGKRQGQQNQQSKPRKNKPARSRSRTPAEVAGLRFFDVPRVDAVDVEGHVLTALLLSAGATATAEAEPTSPLRGALRGLFDLRPTHTRTLLDRLAQQFACWPSVYDREIILGAMRVADIDLLETPFLTDGDWARVRDWLGRRGERLWRNKVLAAAVLLWLRRIESQPRQQQHSEEEGAAGSPSGNFDGALPEALLGEILLFVDPSDLRRFSSASSRCRGLVRRNPLLAGAWRRNLFFAEASCYPQRGCDAWDWKILCANDCPDATCAPYPRYEAFLSADARLVDGGLCGWQHSNVSSRSLKEGGIMRNDDFGIGGQALRAANLSWSNEEFFMKQEGQPSSFFSRSVLGPSIAPTAIMGHWTARDDPLSRIVALVGYDAYGGFIGAGVYPFSGRKRDLFVLKVCCRYLPPDDPRLEWPVERIYSTLQVALARGTPSSSDTPWKNQLFNLDYVSAVSSSSSITLSPCSPCSAIPGFKLQVHLLCDLREQVQAKITYEADKLGRDLDHVCVRCNKSVENAPGVSYRNEDLLGLEELLEWLREGEYGFCDNSCFLNYISGSCQFESICNVTWVNQCWGCGSIGMEDRLRYCHVWHYSESDGVESDFLNSYDPVLFCSEACTFTALPEILRICKEWQALEVTRRKRTLALVCPNGFSAVFGDRPESIELLKCNGWKQVTEKSWALEDPREKFMHNFE